MAEHQRLARLRTPALRQTYGRAHAFLRAVLARYTGLAASKLPFECDANNKPRLAGLPLHFNLSHRPGRALLAVSNAGPVGADVEPLQPLADADALVQQLFSTDEQAALRATEPAGWWPLFYFIWTRKEAYAKALGIGVGMEFAAFSALERLPEGYGVHSFVLAGTSPPSPLSCGEGGLVSNSSLELETSSPSPQERGLGGEVHVCAIATPALLPLHHFHYPADL